MLQINSSEQVIEASAEKVYRVLTQFFQNPLDNIPGVTGFERLENGCRFNVQDQIQCQLTLAEQVPCNRGVYMAETDKPVSAKVTFDIAPCGEESRLWGQADIDVPFFLKPMVKGLVDKFMDTALQYLKTYIEKN